MLYCSIAAFLFFSAFFSASETALFSIPRERIVFFKRHRRLGYRWVYRLLGNGQQTLLMILFGNLFVNITLTGLIDAWMRRSGNGHSVFFTMGIATGVIVLFGEMLPKNIALKNNERVALLCAPVLSSLIWCCRPLLHVIRSVNVYFLAHLSLRLRRPSPYVTVDEFKSGIIASGDRGAISSEEQDMIMSLLERGTMSVRNFMLHRSVLPMLADTATAGEALEKVRDAREPFVVVYHRENTAQVAGIVPVAVLLSSAPEVGLEQLVHPCRWVNDTMEIAEVIGLLLEKRATIAGVTDEYGSFEGVVKWSRSLLRVLSPLLQQSESVSPAGIHLLSKVFAGDIETEIVANWLPPSLCSKDTRVRTLNGLLTNYLGYIPHTGDKFAIDGWNFYIIKADPVKIKSVLIRKKESL